MGYNRANTSPLLKRLLQRADEMVARVEAASKTTASLAAMTT
jgi:hypothetical protein